MAPPGSPRRALTTLRGMLQHVALEVREADAPAEVAFWALLGFLEVEPPESLRGRARWVERDGTQVHLLFTNAPRAAGHIAVLAPAFAEVSARLAAVGRIPELRAQHWGVPRAYVESPAGHRVELMQAAPG